MCNCEYVYLRRFVRLTVVDNRRSRSSLRVCDFQHSELALNVHS
jgi:hypothetical protein